MSELEKLLLAERKSKRYLAELRAVRKALMEQSVSADRDRKIKVIDAELAQLLK